MLVFTYGTLMTDQPNNFLLDDAKNMGRATLIGSYEMVNCGWFPGVYDVADGGNVFGELYRIDDEILKRLDRLEGEGVLYRRVMRRVVTANGCTATAWVYLLIDSEGFPKIIEKNWLKRRNVVDIS